DLGRRTDHIDRGHAVGAERPGDRDGEVVPDPAVDEEILVPLDGCEDAGHGHARPYGAREVARAEDDRAAVAETRRDGAELAGQAVEVAARPGLGIEEELDEPAVDAPRRDQPF